MATDKVKHQNRPACIESNFVLHKKIFYINKALLALSPYILQRGHHLQACIESIVVSNHYNNTVIFCTMHHYGLCPNLPHGVFVNQEQNETKQK